MKKIFMIFTIMTVLIPFGLASFSGAEQNTAPPLLMQQPWAQPSGPGAAPIPPGPGTPPVPPTVPPSPPPGIGQSIPVQTLQNNLSIAVTTARKVGSRFVPGKVWTVLGPGGEITLKAAIMYQGTVVAVLHFNPLNGSLLALGMPFRDCRDSSQAQPMIQSVKAQLPEIIAQLKILPAAQFREPEASWVFPLVLGNKIVTWLKVYYDGLHIVPDYPANQEITCYGQ